VTVVAPLSGHRLLPHTADVIVEAWGPTRDACLREAIQGLVEVFADVDGVVASARLPLTLPPEEGEDLLVALLEEVLYLLDTEDVVPVDATITEIAGGGLHGEFLVAPTGAVAQQGSIPKAIAHHGLEFRQQAGRWRCRVTIDV
jgi:SHS2 domain-containing protein